MVIVDTYILSNITVAFFVTTAIQGSKQVDFLQKHRQTTTSDMGNGHISGNEGYSRNEYIFSITTSRKHCSLSDIGHKPLNSHS